MDPMLYEAATRPGRTTDVGCAARLVGEPDGVPGLTLEQRGPARTPRHLLVARRDVSWRSLGDMTVQTRRVYADPTPDDGYRVLVDRLWPRGLSKERARVDRWLKDVAPSTGLRTWFHHDRALFDEFAARYRAELDQNPAVDELRSIIAVHPVVTLLYGSQDEQDNQAGVLRDHLAAADRRASDP
ncbi:uncharacterized protein YeaO (DUF488 family) [Oerskovia jenensis]|uniref:Uncharacterized protein YeaO (DUF488 family) n=2 Tax=Oerskovia jenensis TaxID=162169 RepID=A0ABS2LKM4_9CELL|nr:uncharacterized protein YeaO (DUF488 family) [Oerskovia jenensis]